LDVTASIRAPRSFANWMATFPPPLDPTVTVVWFFQAKDFDNALQCGEPVTCGGLYHFRNVDHGKTLCEAAQLRLTHMRGGTSIS